MANASKKIALEARGIRASLGNKPVLHGIDLALPAGRDGVTRCQSDHGQLNTLFIIAIHVFMLQRFQLFK
jgi:hypothetical protein